MIFNLVLCFILIVIYMLTRLGRKSATTKDKVFLVIAFVIIFVVIASREMTVGSDTANYLELFRKCDLYKWDILDMGNYYEKGYLAFNVLLSYLNISPRLFLCVMGFIFSFAVYKFIKDNSNNYLMSVLMFINLLFLYQSMAMMRQFMALSVVLLFGMKFVKDRKLIRFIVVVALASLFHSTALIALLIYPIYRLKYTRKRVFIILAGAVLGLIFLSQIYPFVASLLDKETYYVGMIGETKLGNIVATLIYLAMYIFSLFVIKPEKRQNYSFYLYSLLFAAAANFVSIDMAVLSRASQYFTILSIIALPNIIEANVKESKVIMQSVIVGLMIVYASVIMVNKPEWNTAFNYKTCIMPESGYICE